MLDDNNIRLEKIQERVFKPKRATLTGLYLKSGFVEFSIKSLLFIGVFLVGYMLIVYPQMTIFQKYFAYFSGIVAISFAFGIFANKLDAPKNKNSKLVENTPKDKYMLSFGLKVKEFYGDAKRSTFLKNIVKPLIYNAEKFKRHVMIIATVGGGKSFLMKGLAELQIILGGGFFIIDGKGTAEFAKEMFGLSALYGRAADFIHLNFLDKNNSHSINPLKSGSVGAIYELLIALLVGEENEWKQKQKEYMKNILKLLIYKRDNEDLELTFTVVAEYMTLSKLVNEALLYRGECSKNSSIKDFVNYISSSIGISLDEFLYAEFEIDYTSDKKIYPRGRIPDQPDNAFLQKVRKNETDTRNQGVYDLSMSVSAWRGVITTLGSDYKEILNAEQPTTTLWEVIQHNKLLFVTLPTLESQDTPKDLGRLMLGLLNGVAQEKAKSGIQPEIPFLAMFDEIGSYIVNGFGRLKSKCRSLGISVVSIFQSFSQLDQVDDGKGMETKEMLDVTGTLVVMKVVNPDVTELINKKLPQSRFIDRNYQERRKHIKDSQVSAEDSFQVMQEDIIKHHEVEAMNDGEMLLITDGEIHRAVANVEINFRKHGKVVTYEGNMMQEPLPIQQYMKKESLYRQIEENAMYWDKNYKKEKINGMAAS